MRLTRRQVLGAVSAMAIIVAMSGVAQAEEGVRLSTIEELAQELADQAAQDAKAQGWEVSPAKIESAKARIIQNLRKSFGEQQIAVRSC